MRILSVLALCAGLLLACSRSAPAPSAPVAFASADPTPTDVQAPVPSPEPGFPYGISLRDKNGELTTSAAVLDRGKPTVVLYWLTTCMPCMLEMRAIKAKYAQWKAEADFNLVAISTDWEKNAHRIFPVAEEQGWPWPVYHDEDRQFRTVLPGALNGLPQSFIFSAGGEIVYHKRKYRPGDEDALFAKLKSL